MEKVLVYGTYGACVVRVSSVLNSGNISVNLAVQTNVAPNASRTSTIIPQYMTKSAMDQVCDQPGLSASITV